LERPAIALIEDDSATITVMTDLLADEGFRTFQWRQGQGAFDLIKEQRPNAIILDIRLEHQRTGMEVLDALRGDRNTRGIPIIVCTGDEEFIEEHEERLRTQHYEVVRKPFTLDLLLGKVRNALKQATRNGRARNYPLPRRPAMRLPPETVDAAVAPEAPVIALVDGSPAGVTRLTERLGAYDYGVEPRRWGNGIYETIRRIRPAMAVIEIEQADRRVAWRTLNRLQRDSETRDIPILLCSTDAPFLASQAGRYLVIQQPLDPTDLVKRIETAIGPPPPRPASKRRERTR
jgi:CheY-like chemotaxis protein